LSTLTLVNIVTVIRIFTSLQMQNADAV